MNSIFCSVYPRLVFAVALFCSALAAQPKISLSPSRSELGTIYEGEIKTIRLVVANTGNEPLTIKTVETSCGCTSAKKPKPVLQPNESDTILVTFNSARFNGPITKHVTVQSNDPSIPFIDADFTGTVTSELLPVPWVSIINIGRQPIGKKNRFPFSFTNTSRDTLVLKGFTCADSNITVTFHTTRLLPADTVSVDFIVTPQTEYFMDAMVYLQTNSTHQPQIPIRVGYAGKYGK